ncbi:Shedu anti-phage system protein SduA domain-containing protein [Nonomuraea dietziae]|uniref:Shedu anti-phage system protein SduA domain-containing protein n=1 Tax=Nonomuraea dietziae TaxID=65515 RepID=UPI0034067AEC
MDDGADLAPKTAQLYEGLLRLHINPTLGDKLLVEITSRHVRQWHTKLVEHGSGSSTVAKAYRLLRGILNTAVEDELMDLQRALEGQHWIFGGRFVGEAAQRRLVSGDEVDIPLIRGDGSLYIVELKRAMSMKGSLVKRHRGAWVPTAEVHDAVGQAVNYLVGLDENRQQIFEDFGIETRRASAVVLIGHPDVQPSVPEREINEALRTFNTHVNRVEVITYKELIDNAKRSLGDL